MPEQLHYLQPKFFIVQHHGFNYEVITCHEYYPDASESNDPMGGIDFTGNYLVTMLTPNGTIQTVIDSAGEDPFDSTPDFDLELYRKIIKLMA